MDVRHKKEPNETLDKLIIKKCKTILKKSIGG